MIGLDSNVILRHLVDNDDVQSPVAHRLFESLSPRTPGFVSRVVVAEVAWSLRSGYGFSRSRVLDVLDELLASDDLEFEDGETVWRAVMQARAGADFADALIKDTADLFGCEEVVTFDQGAARTLGMRLLA